MAAPRLRRWGSQRLLAFAAGLTLLAMPAGAGSGISTTVPPGLSGGATVAAASAATPHAVLGASATGLNVAVHSAKPDGCAAGVATNHDSRGKVAPCSVLYDPLSLDESARRTAAHADVLPALGVAYAPQGPRAPPLRLA